MSDESISTASYIEDEILHYERLADGLEQEQHEKVVGARIGACGNLVELGHKRDALLQAPEDVGTIYGQTPDEPASLLTYGRYRSEVGKQRFVQTPLL